MIKKLTGKRKDLVAIAEALARCKHRHFCRLLVMTSLGGVPSKLTAITARGLERSLGGNTMRDLGFNSLLIRRITSGTTSDRE
jgi:hypothetical protein